MNLGKLFDWQYLTAPYALTGLSWPMRIILMLFFTAAIILAVQATIKLKNNTDFKNLWKKLQAWGFYIGSVGWLLIFFREVRAVYLGSRIWLLIWLIFALVWLVMIIRYWKIQIPLQTKTRQERAEFEKWLPKKKS